MGKKIEIDGMICEEIEKGIVEEQVESKELGTCPSDPRFQQTNKTKWCYTMFIDFHRCAYLLGEADKHCQYFYRCYQILCPNDWKKTWAHNIADGTFPRDLTKEMGR